MYNTEKKRFDCQARAGNEWYTIAHCNRSLETEVVAGKLNSAYLDAEEELVATKAVIEIVTREKA